MNATTVENREEKYSQEKSNGGPRHARDSKGRPHGKTDAGRSRPTSRDPQDDMNSCKQLGHEHRLRGTR